jgi:adenosylmethionine-8-amino-7-oxononanoate aminotransferase
MLSDRNPEPSGLVERDLAVFWHPCSQMRDFEDLPPFEVTAARGARLLLADGRQVLDAISSWWCKSLGHGHPGVRARIERQLARFEHVIAANTTHLGLVELCERLLDIANGQPRSPVAPRSGHFGKVFLADNGSTAVEIAMKMALQAQLQRGHAGRTGFASLAGGYHGETLATLSVGDLGLYSDPYRPLMFPVTKLGPIPYRAGLQDPRWQDAGPEWPEIERCLRSVAGSLAAIVYEPVLQAAGGMRIYSPDLLRRLRRFADANGIFLIADEIAAGMGRLGTMLASELALISTGTGGGSAAPAGAVGHRGVLPDFLVLSKGLTAGFLPLSAVLTTNDIYAVFDGDWAARRAFLHSNTHTGNALAIAAALGALDAYESEGILQHVATEGPRMLAALTDLAQAHHGLTRARGVGMVAAVDLCAPGGGALDPRARTGRRVFQEAVKRGALLRPLGDTLYLFPPLNCPPGDLDDMLAILAASVAAVVGR